jgi:hypothetical protein
VGTAVSSFNNLGPSDVRPPESAWLSALVASSTVLLVSSLAPGALLIGYADRLARHLFTAEVAHDSFSPQAAYLVGCSLLGFMRLSDTTSPRHSPPSRIMIEYEDAMLRRIMVLEGPVRVAIQTSVDGLKWLVLAAIALLFAAAPTHADPQEIPLKPNEEALVDLSGNPQDADDTALRIVNLSGNSGLVTIDFDPMAGLGPNDSVASGFALVDGTLTVSSDIPAGELRARYRVEAGGRALGRVGIRANEARMLRRDARTGRWRPAIRALKRRATVRYLRDTRADFVLGHHGFSTSSEYVWAVIDVNSSYAAGGSTASPVPLLGPLALLGLGGVLLVTAARVHRSG